MTRTAELAPLTAPGFGPRVIHGFFGRAGGTSKGFYRGLNCGFGSGDEKEKVAENRVRVAAAQGLFPANLLSVYQTHSPGVLVVDRAHTYEEAPKADGMVTVKPGLGLAMLFLA